MSGFEIASFLWKVESGKWKVARPSGRFFRDDALREVLSSRGCGSHRAQQVESGVPRGLRLQFNHIAHKKFVGNLNLYFGVGQGVYFANMFLAEDR